MNPAQWMADMLAICPICHTKVGDHYNSGYCGKPGGGMPFLREKDKDGNQILVPDPANPPRGRYGEAVRWIKCVDPSKLLTKGRLYQLLDEAISDDDEEELYITINDMGKETRFFQYRFEEVFPSNSPTVAVPTQSNSNSDPEEERCWKAMRTSSDPSQCPCGSRRGVCQYHP